MKRLPALHWQILAALVAGGLCGWAVGAPMLKIAFLGDLFLRGLKMVIVPLVSASIICGVTGVGDPRQLGRLGARTFAYYVATSLLAIVTGLVLVNLIEPGVGIDLGLRQQPDQLQASLAAYGESPWQAIVRLFLDMVPSNPIAAMAEGNILQIIFFCLLFGLFITRLPEGPRVTLTGFFDALFQAIMGVTHFVLAFAPIGIFALVAKMVATTGTSAFAGLGLYAVTVAVGLAVHAGITLPLGLFLLARVSAARHVQAMSPALMTAFSTSSSSATLPLTLDCLETRSGVSNRTASFVAPLGATVNMDGTALYECVAAMFIAQAYGVDLSFGQQFLVVMTALLASIGAAGIPMAGLVMISVVLTAVGLPLEGVGLILAVDRILDMCRTTVNVWSDSCGAVVVARSQGEEPYSDRSS